MLSSEDIFIRKRKKGISKRKKKMKSKTRKALIFHLTSKYSFQLSQKDLLLIFLNFLLVFFGTLPTESFPSAFHLYKAFLFAIVSTLSLVLTTLKKEE